MSSILPFSQSNILGINLGILLVLPVCDSFSDFDFLFLFISEMKTFMGRIPFEYLPETETGKMIWIFQFLWSLLMILHSFKSLNTLF